MAKEIKVPAIVKGEEVTCPRASCGHTWTAKTDNPKSCPRCKQYLPNAMEGK